MAAVAALLAVAIAVATLVLDAGGNPTAGRPKRSHRHTAALAPPPTRPARPRPRRPPPPRITGIVRFRLTLTEPASVSIATDRSSSGQPIRVLPTTVRYPLVRHPVPGMGFPLVVFSQGFDEPAQAYAGLLNTWTRAGYVVAAPTYPHTDPASAGAVDEADIVNHPADLRFVISALQAAARNPRNRLHGVMSPGAVAVTGQSDGGDVSLAVAADSCCRDDRVKAAMILSGAELAAFGGTYFGSQRSAPLLVTQGSADTINVPACSAQIYDQSPAPKYYLDIAGAPHLPPYIDPGPTRRGIELTTVAFLDRFLKHRPSAVRRVRPHLPPDETLISGPNAPGPAGAMCPGAP